MFKVPLLSKSLNMQNKLSEWVSAPYTSVSATNSSVWS